MSSLGKVLIGLVALTALGIFGIHLGGLGLVEQGHGGAREAERLLTQSAQTALKTAQMDWAQVRLSGQKAIIEGLAPSPDARNRAVEVVQNAACVRPDQCGGLVLGGITVVEDIRLAVASAPSAPLKWQAAFQRGAPLVLEGSVPSETAREQMLSETAALFPGGTDDSMVLREMDDISNWLPTAQTQLEALALLNAGRIEAEGSKFVLTGVAADNGVKQRAEAVLASLPDTIDATVSISLAEPAPASITPRLDPEAEVEPLPATTDTVDRCQKAFDKAMREGVINFGFKSADLPEDSLSLLDRLAQTARQCASLQIEVGGHTDSIGTIARNQNLSEARAQAVRRHLVALGVPAGQITARGYSEQRPVASNETEQGRAANRRIEFTVSLDSEQ